MKKYKVVAHINLEDELEFEDDMSEKEIQQNIEDYVFGILDFNFYEIQEDEEEENE